MEPGLPGAGVSALPLRGCLCRGRLSPASQDLKDWARAQFPLLRR